MLHIDGEMPCSSSNSISECQLQEMDVVLLYPYKISFWSTKYDKTNQSLRNAFCSSQRWKKLLFIMQSCYDWKIGWVFKRLLKIIDSHSAGKSTIKLWLFVFLLIVFIQRTILFYFVIYSIQLFQFLFWI